MCSNSRIHRNAYLLTNRATGIAVFEGTPIWYNNAHLRSKIKKRTSVTSDKITAVYTSTVELLPFSDTVFSCFLPS